MHFAGSEYLYLLWLIPALGLFFAWSLRNRRRRLERLISPALAPRLTREFSRGKAALRALLLVCGFAFLVLALSRPQWGMKMETVRRRGVDMIVALDTSYSMNAEDVAPSRLTKAKAEIRAFLQRLKGDRIGLTNFAGSAFVQCPLTLDYGAIGLFLDVSSTESVRKLCASVSMRPTKSPGSLSTFRPKKSLICVLAMITAMPLVKPTTTGRGINFTAEPRPVAPRTTSRMPASSVHMYRPSTP